MKIISSAAIAAVLSVGAGTYVYFSLRAKITQRLEKGWVIPPLELYSQGFDLEIGRRFESEAVLAEIQRREWQNQRDFLIDNADACARLTGVQLKPESQKCLWLKTAGGGPLIVTWDEHGFVREIWSGLPWLPVSSYSLFPRLITQFYDGQPIQQKNTPLSEMPLTCLQGATAIEDKDFLEHRGVSATGILRAVYRNLRARRWAEGGSTITQQLVKNFFLSSKKTLSRKIEEQFLALMLEAQLTKDQILEMYLNVIYMGQNGPYQVRGFGSASQYYFDRPVSELSLPQCALLAAMINNPGRYSPFAHPDAAATRRELVLRKMVESDMIGERDLQTAATAPLPSRPQDAERTHAPYFVMAALKEFESLGLEMEEGAKLYTTLDPQMQTQLETAITSKLPAVEKRVRHPSRQPLESAAVTVDVKTGRVLALVGGRSFRETQFNRAVDSRRQIGSIVKPFVYWPAMQTHDPLTPVDDHEFEWKMAGRIWRPKNYDGESFGIVPYFWALANSLNVPAARVGQEVGLENVEKTLEAAGISEPISLLPSLTLGAVELSPLEVAQAYLTLARLGAAERAHILERVEDSKGTQVYIHRPATGFALDPKVTSVVVGMMEQTLNLGTARSARVLGVQGPFAGKTGTTSDTKDAWFAGFNPRWLTVVWVGYDDNTKTGMTGSVAALPIWIQFANSVRDFYAAEDFQWPEGIQQKTFDSEQLLQKFPGLKELPSRIQLNFQ